MRGLNLDKMLEPLVEEVEFLYPDGGYNLPPSGHPTFKRLQSSFSARRTYIERMGFALLSHEFKAELSKVFLERDIHTFLDLGAGVGSIIELMFSLGLTGKGYGLEITEKNGWGMKPFNKSYIRMRSTNDLIIQDITELILPADYSYDMAIMSWVQMEGSPHVDFMKNNSLPKWILSINEGEGGCTGSTIFWDWLNSNYEYEYGFKSHESFHGIYDNAILYKLKGD